MPSLYQTVADWAEGLSKPVSHCVKVASLLRRWRPDVGGGPGSLTGLKRRTGPHD